MKIVKNFSNNNKTFSGNFPIFSDNLKICPNLKSEDLDSFLNLISEDCNCEDSGFFKNKESEDFKEILFNCIDGKQIVCYEYEPPIIVTGQIILNDSLSTGLNYNWSGFLSVI
jgi:hypothetical protein